MPDSAKEAKVRKVTGRGGRFRTLIARLMGLPAAASHVRVELKVTVEGSRERWGRQFGTRLMETVQWARDRLLIESAGSVRFGFKIEINRTTDSNRSAHRPLSSPDSSPLAGTMPWDAPKLVLAWRASVSARMVDCDQPVTFGLFNRAVIARELPATRSAPRSPFPESAGDRPPTKR